MRRAFIALALTAALLALAGGRPSLAAAPEGPRHVKVGHPAPEFNLPGSDGRMHRLSDYIGHKAVIIAWFPQAFTGG